MLREGGMNYSFTSIRSVQLERSPFKIYNCVEFTRSFFFFFFAFPINNKILLFFVLFYSFQMLDYSFIITSCISIRFSYNISTIVAQRIHPRDLFAKELLKIFTISSFNISTLNHYHITKVYISQKFLVYQLKVRHACLVCNL